jgi:hypothetical protein
MRLRQVSLNVAISLIVSGFGVYPENKPVVGIACHEAREEFNLISYD